MYFNFILTILVLHVMATPFLFLQAMKYGIKFAEKPEETSKEPMFTLPKKKKPVKMTPEEERDAQILANVDRFVGNSKGQKKITR